MKGSFTSEATRTPTLSRFQLAASVLILIGFFAPWIAHDSAALTVTGYEMSEFAKFFPQVQSGMVPVRRALFITPFFAAIISTALVIRRSPMRSLFRLGATALAVFLSLAVLPPHQSILEPAYRAQLIVVAVGMLLTAATVLTGQLTERVRGILTLLVALAGAVPALWQYILLRPLVAELYRAPVLPGWGLVVCVIGLVLLSVIALRDIFTG